MTDKKWYFDTIEEAKAAMPKWKKIYKAVNKLDFGSNCISGYFVPVSSKCKNINGNDLCHVVDYLELIEKRKKEPTLGELLDEISQKQQDTKMTLQNQAKELLPFVQAMAEGKEVQFKCDGEWLTKVCPNFVYGIELRIAPETIIVNGFEIEAPMKEVPYIDEPVFFSDATHPLFCDGCKWGASEFHLNLLARGLCHKTRAAAIAHAKAMIGIDPNK